MAQEKISSSAVAGLSRKNYIINGGFDVWQRGTSGTAGAFAPDRWYLYDVDAWSRQSFTLGQTAVPGSPKYYFRFERNVAASVAQLVYQNKIEGVHNLAGQAVNVSFWAKTDATKTLQIDLTQNFGTGGSPSSAVVVGSGDIVFNTTWTKHSVQLSVASISGMTLGTGGDDNISFRFKELDNFSTFVLDITNIQVEKGTSATDFEQRTIGEELALCQRYYEKSYPTDKFAGDTTSAGGAVAQTSNGTSGVANTAAISAYVRYSVRKRASASVTTYQPSTGASGNWRNAATGGSITSGVVSTGSSGFNIINSATVNDQQWHHIHWVADAEL